MSFTLQVNYAFCAGCLWPFSFSLVFCNSIVVCLDVVLLFSGQVLEAQFRMAYSLIQVISPVLSLDIASPPQFPFSFPEMSISEFGIS